MHFQYQYLTKDMDRVMMPVREDYCNACFDDDYYYYERMMPCFWFVQMLMIITTNAFE